MKKIILGFLLLNISIPSYSDNVTEYKKILWGRKDLIQSDLIKSIVTEKSNDTDAQVCKGVIQSFMAANSMCDSVTNHLIKQNESLQKENENLKIQLSQCKPVKKN